MSWLTSILPIAQQSEQRSVSVTTNLSNPADWFFKIFGLNVGGATVNHNTAMKLGAFWACVERYAEGIGSLPLFVYERMDDGSRRVAANHPNYFLLHNEPSPLYSSMTWRMTANLHLATWGNSYSIIIRDEMRRVKRLQIVEPWKVDVFEAEGGIFYHVEGFNSPFRADDILHIHGMGWNGLTGLSPISYHAETIGTGLAQNSYGKKFYENGAKYSGVFETEGPIEKPQRDKFRDSIEKFNKEKEGGAPILPWGIKFKPINIPQKDAEFIATKVKNIEEVARIMNVPLPLIQSHEQSTSYNSIEQLMLMWVLHSLRPKLINWEMEINRKLFRSDERGRFYAEFNVNGLLRGDMKTRTEMYRTLWERGVFSGNQIADLENMPRYEGGDRRFVPLNMAPLDQIDEYFKTLINKNETGNQNNAGDGGDQE